MEVTEKDMEPEVTPVPIISESEELRNGIDNETIEEIAANLTPDMYEHYRSVMNSFEPDSEEYKNASAVVDMYDRQSAINTLHQGNSR
ncbi:MAG: GPO family capsid scaffolding protein [Bacilli bacterium]|nr:GPO family capsid scaffolding protein [Bacilli bacterium]